MLLLTLLSVGEIATSGPCAGKNLAGPSETLLRGAHLRVMEMVWPPYAEKDPSSPSGWRGFDIDLLDAVAAQLGFTYTISEAPALLSGETYTDLLLRTVTETDLWLSWWLRSQERMNSTAMLAGHVDASPVLVSQPPKKQNSAPRFDAFFAPFSYPLWACIGLMIVASGFVDYALEYGYGGSLPSSIHEYFSGVLFGGFQDPHTRLSAFFQICCALIVMIVVSAYTANLAAFLTLSNSPSRGFGSVHDLISSRTAACTVGSYASQATLEAVYSGMSFDVAHTSGGYAAVGDALVHGNCEAAILQKVDFDALLTDGCNCGLSVVGASLFFATAGWVTNLNTSSTLCVQRPIEYALHSLQADSTLDTIFNRYMQPAGCVPSSDPRCTSSTATSVRRLQADYSLQTDATATDTLDIHLDVRHGGRLDTRGSDGLTHGGSVAGGAALTREGRHVGRRLSAGSGGPANAAATSSSSSSSDDALPEMTPEHFWGVFVLWGCAAGLVLSMRMVSYFSPALRRLVGTADPTESEEKDYMPDPSAYPSGLDINNQSAMLRFLVIELHHLRERVDQLQGTAKEKGNAEPELNYNV